MKDQDSFSIGIRRSVFNNRLVELRRTRGFTQIGFAEYVGIHKATYSEIETLKRYPTETEAYAIADALEVDAVELFPKWSFPVYGRLGTGIKIVEVKPLELGSSEVLKLAEPKEISEDLEKEDMARILKDLLNTLNPRERKVLELRFGLDEENRGRNLLEVGKEFGVTRERIRQIEAKALRKLRHPSRSKRLERFL